MGKFLEAVAFLTVVEALGFAGAAADGLTRKLRLEKPAAWPPKLVFPLAWSLINYSSITISTWLIWERRTEIEVVLALSAVGITHSVLFGAIVNRSKSASVYVLMDVLGDCIGAAQAVGYSRVSNRAVVALTPYLFWLAYTTWIKVGLARLNP